MVHRRWIRVVWPTMCRCEFPPRLVTGLAVTQGTELVCLGHSKRAVLLYVMKRSYVFVRQILKDTYMFGMDVRKCKYTCNGVLEQ